MLKECEIKALIDALKKLAVKRRSSETTRQPSSENVEEACSLSVAIVRVALLQDRSAPNFLFERTLQESGKNVSLLLLFRILTGTSLNIYHGQLKQN